MAYTLTEAATATGLSRSTIFRAIKSGRISAARIEGNFSIEPAELHRVFQPVSEKRADGGAMNYDATAAAVADKARMAALEAQITALRGVSAAMDERLREMREDRDAWRQQAQQAMHQLALPKPQPEPGRELVPVPQPAPPARRWWWLRSA